jgi:transcriptional regulator
VGLRIPVKRFEGKRKMSQNRPEADRIGVAAGLAASEKPQDQEVAPLISLPAGANPS